MTNTKDNNAVIISKEKFDRKKVPLKECVNINEVKW